ncbi:DUF6115 domain-containing protein [Helicobacter anatolicus]|uniref:DUF6115 domain-containing protein n=1 Tax=Helicobacter anatolicus TaxID=2905874 RepID=UPI001E4C4667|nr:helix-turn-helix domain-containing protein [Helicobacter anatolicus]MCE3038281.1 helix-turn-helix domain-containing protein [Helicobacter anatolicus]MCE3039152.1 helix-turn-helix domain-containing protein [Helicobacter anatolicus]
MINEVIMGISGIVFILLCVVVDLYLKDKKNTKKYALLEESIDKFTNELHQLQRNIQEIKVKEEFVRLTMGDEFQNNVESGLNQFYQQLKEMKENIRNERNYLEEKIIKLENRVRDFGYLSGDSDVDEKRIIALFQEGWSIDSIAKELRIGRGEVEFTLKLADI